MSGVLDTPGWITRLAGQSYDNALAESINADYKNELVDNGPLYPGMAELALATAEWVAFYNLGAAKHVLLRPHPGPGRRAALRSGGVPQTGGRSQYVNPPDLPGWIIATNHSRKDIPTMHGCAVPQIEEVVMESQRRIRLLDDYPFQPPRRKSVR